MNDEYKETVERRSLHFRFLVSQAIAMFIFLYRRIYDYVGIGVGISQ